jgi:hypothetical protein
VDFVIVGIVIGAVLVAAGALLRDLGPRLRPKITRLDAQSIEPDKLARAWSRYCQLLGMTVTTLGFLLVVATVVGFFLDVSSGAGWTIVGVMTVLAVAGTVASVVRINNHYRTGGFDPRERVVVAAPSFEPPRYDAELSTLIVADEVVPLAPDDPFASPEPAPVEQAAVVAVKSTTEADFQPNAEAPVSTDSADAGDRSTSKDREPAPGYESAGVVDVGEIEAPPREAEPLPVAPELEFPDVPEPHVAEVPGLDVGAAKEIAFEEHVEPWQPTEPDWQSSDRLPPAQVPVLSGFEPPLIDPDEDLPAWGAPPAVERITPLPVLPPVPPEGSRVFESSLLADLQPESSPAEELAGPFQSRLLNELTARQDESEPDGNDVLIAEAPVADSNRGARSE